MLSLCVPANLVHGFICFPLFTTIACATLFLYSLTNKWTVVISSLLYSGIIIGLHCMVFRLCYGLFLQLVMVSMASLGCLFFWFLCRISCKIVHIFVEENYYLIVLFSFFSSVYRGFFLFFFLNHRNGFKQRVK